jgi:hypothetical protein
MIAVIEIIVNAGVVRVIVVGENAMLDQWANSMCSK